MLIVFHDNDYITLPQSYTHLQNNALTSPKAQTYIEKAPICSKTDFGPAEAAGRSQTRPVEDFGTDGGFYSNYPLYLGDVGHVSGTTSLRSPSCALRSVKCVCNSS